MAKPKKELTRKKVLSCFFITVVGFILLNIAFLFIAAITNGLTALYKLIISNNYPDINTNILVGHISLIISILLIGVISFFVLKSKKIKTIYKATYLMVPLATIYAVIGMFLNQWVILVYLLGALFFISVFYYFKHTKKSWLYYYVLILTSVVMLLVILLRVEI